MVSGKGWEGHFGIFPMALVPSWEQHERGRKSSDMSQGLSSCGERMKIRFGILFKIILRNPRIPSFLGTILIFVLQSSAVKHPAVPERSLDSSFARGERYPQFQAPLKLPSLESYHLYDSNYELKNFQHIKVLGPEAISVFLKLKLSSLLSL